MKAISRDELRRRHPNIALVLDEATGDPVFVSGNPLTDEELNTILLFAMGCHPEQVAAAIAERRALGWWARLRLWWRRR